VVEPVVVPDVVPLVVPVVVVPVVVVPVVVVPVVVVPEVVVPVVVVPVVVVPSVVVPEVEPEVVPAFSDVVQALKRLSDAHSSTPVRAENNLLFIGIRKSERMRIARGSLLYGSKPRDLSGFL
jgi:hypothetical protein